MRIAALLACFLGFALGGCEPDPVLISITGILYDCADVDTCDTVPEADVSVLDIEEVVHAEDLTDADGAFQLDDVPGMNVVFLTAEKADGYVPTSFLGQTGTVDGVLSDGSLFIVPTDEATGLVDEFDATHPEGGFGFAFDPETDDSGGMVRGRFYVPVEGIDAASWPGATGTSCFFEDADGGSYPCVYYDVDGNPDWSLQTTTTDGGWAAFGLPAGLLTGVVLDDAADVATQYALFYTYVVEDGLTVFDYFPIPF